MQVDSEMSAAASNAPRKTPAAALDWDVKTPSLLPAVAMDSSNLGSDGSGGSGGASAVSTNSPPKKHSRAGGSSDTPNTATDSKSGGAAGASGASSAPSFIETKGLRTTKIPAKSFIYLLLTEAQIARIESLRTTYQTDQLIRSEIRSDQRNRERELKAAARRALQSTPISAAVKAANAAAAKHAGDSGPKPQIQSSLTTMQARSFASAIESDPESGGESSEDDSADRSSMNDDIWHTIVDRDEWVEFFRDVNTAMRAIRDMETARKAAAANKPVGMTGTGTSTAVNPFTLAKQHHTNTSAAAAAPQQHTTPQVQSAFAPTSGASLYAAAYSIGAAPAPSAAARDVSMVDTKQSAPTKLAPNQLPTGTVTASSEAAGTAAAFASVPQSGGVSKMVFVPKPKSDTGAGAAAVASGKSGKVKPKRAEIDGTKYRVLEYQLRKQLLVLDTSHVPVSTAALLTPRTPLPPAPNSKSSVAAAVSASGGSGGGGSNSSGGVSGMSGGDPLIGGGQTSSIPNPQYWSAYISAVERYSEGGGGARGCLIGTSRVLLQNSGSQHLSLVDTHRKAGETQTFLTDSFGKMNLGSGGGSAAADSKSSVKLNGSLKFKSPHTGKSNASGAAAAAASFGSHPPPPQQQQRPTTFGQSSLTAMWGGGGGGGGTQNSKTNQNTTATATATATTAAANNSSGSSNNNRRAPPSSAGGGGGAPAAPTTSAFFAGNVPFNRSAPANTGTAPMF